MAVEFPNKVVPQKRAHVGDGERRRLVAEFRDHASQDAPLYVSLYCLDLSVKKTRMVVRMR